MEQISKKVIHIIGIILTISIHNTIIGATNDEILIEQEFNNNVVESQFASPQYIGNNNDYINKMIHCTKFKASANDPVCKDISPSAAAQSFFNSNVKKMNQGISNTIDDIKNKPTQTSSQIADKNNEIENNTIISNTNNNIESKQQDYIIAKEYDTNKSNNKIQTLAETGPNTNILIILIFFTSLISYIAWMKLEKNISNNNKTNLPKS